MKRRFLVTALAAIALLPLILGCHGSGNATLGFNAAGDPVGTWWYSGGIDDEGGEYDLSDLPGLEYIRITFNADGTFDVEYRYCGATAVTGAGTWEVDPATGELHATGDILGQHTVTVADTRLEARDADTGWTYFFADTETTNDCPLTIIGDPSSFNLPGTEWWYMGSRDVGGDELRVVASLEYLRIHLGIDGYVRVFTKACGDTVTRASGTWTYEQSPCSGDDCLFGPQYIVHLAGTDVLGQQDMKIYPELYYALVEDIQSGEVHVFGFREILHDCGG